MDIISYFAHFVTDDIHNTTDDMIVSVVRTGFRNTLERCSAEGQLIFKCQTIQPHGMNIDFSFYLDLHFQLFTDEYYLTDEYY